MNESDLSAFLKADKKPDGTIKGYVHSVKIYETYLLNHKHIDNPDNATPQDLADFVAWGRRELDNAYRHLWGVRAYYHFRQIAEMWYSTSEWMEFLQNETRKLGEFPGVDLTAVKKLKSIGITTANQLLRAGKTEADRSTLAEKCGAALDSVMELVKLSDLARLPGLKKVRGRLFYEAGLDTLSKIAKQEPEEIHRLLMAYIEKSGFNGTPPTYSEAQFTIRMAKFLNRKDIP